jgi:hypothetical protein
MTCKFHRHENLTLKVYFHNISLCVNEIQFILFDSIKLNIWSKLEKKIDHLLDKHYNVSLESVIKDVTDRIETIKYKLMQEDDSEKTVSRISFLREQ